MRSMKVALLASVLLGSAGVCSAQSTTGTIRGHVADAQGLVLPGVTISVTSPNLQGTRVAVTSVNGDYIVTLLPSGTYAVTFDLTGFQRQQRTVTLAPTQNLPLDIAMGPAPVNEEVVVVGRTADVLTHTAQVAIDFKQDLLSTLPTNRDINAAILMAPSVHATGANGAYSISGSVSFENLFMVNGVSVTENLRGQPYDLYIEDAVQETTVATGGISAEYGRFTGGVVNVITKSGGNTFSGSLRDTLQNDKWRTLTPFEETSIAADPAHKDTRVHKTVPTYEYTFGGPAVKDHLWFFTAGRMQTQESGRALVVTTAPYTFSSQEKRFEFKGTYSVNPNHRLQAVLTSSTTHQQNATQNPATSMDTNSLYDPDRLMNLFTFNYTGVVTPRFFVEARVSARNETLQNVGARSTDRIAGTLLVDRANRRYWAATFCGVCDPEQRDGADMFIKGSYFLSTNTLGSHSMAFGYDGYNDKRFANNHQSGSDYRIVGTNSIVRGAGDQAVIYPQFLPDGNTLIAWQPILVNSDGSNFRTHSLFYSDNWRISSRLTANLGLRYDRNHGGNSVGDVVTKDSAISPRLGIVWDPTGGQKWSVTGSFAKYVAGIANTIGDSTSPGGNFDSYAFAYGGPAINADPNGALLPSDVALGQLFNWFDTHGGAALPMAGSPTVRGVTPQITSSLKSPNTLEYAGGVSRQFGARAAVRVDATYRDFHDFYVQRTDLSTGRVVDTRTEANIPPAVRGRVYDLTVLENTDMLKRRYAALATQGQYRMGRGLDAGGTYTLSHLWGNVDAETLNSGPTASDALQYPEYRSGSWNYPEGDLAADQRHRARLWVNYGIPHVPELTASVLEILETGVPYGAVGTVNSQAYVANPGYLTPPAASSIAYYYTARDAYRTAGQKRTDFALSYARHVGPSHVELFGQFQVLNLFNQYQLCACGASTVFSNGGSVIVSRIDQTVRTPVTNGTVYAAFNPFTTTPAEGVNWAKAPTFGTALSRLAYTTPQTLRITFGVRF